MTDDEAVARLRACDLADSAAASAALSELKGRDLLRGYGGPGQLTRREWAAAVRAVLANHGIIVAKRGLSRHAGGKRTARTGRTRRQ